MANSDDQTVINQMLADAPAVESSFGAVGEAAAPAAATPAQPAFSDEKTRQHGRTMAKVWKLVAKDLTGKDLDPDLAGTAEDVAGEAMGIFSLFTNRAVYVGALLALTLIPIGGSFYWRLRSDKAKDVTNG